MPATGPNDLNLSAHNDAIVMVSDLLVFHETPSVYRLGPIGCKDVMADTPQGPQTVPRMMIEKSYAQREYLQAGRTYQQLTIWLPRWLAEKLGFKYTVE